MIARCLLMAALAGSLVMSVASPSLAQSKSSDLILRPIENDVVITNVSARKFELEPTRNRALTFNGRGLDKVADVHFTRRGQPQKGFTTSLSCKTTSCILNVKAPRNATPATYHIELINRRGRVLATLPVRLVILQPADYEPEPDRIVVIEGPPGVSVQFSCTQAGEFLSDDVALVAPQPNGGVVDGTTLEWERADAEHCGLQTDPRYVLAICNNGSPNFACNPANGLWLQISIEPSVLGNGMCVVGDPADPCGISVDELVDETGVAIGDTVYWQMLYRSDGPGGVPFNDANFTPKRPLTLGESEPEPEPEPDPAPGGPPVPSLIAPPNGTAFSMTNRIFAWTDDSPDGAPNWTWNACFMTETSDACIANGPFARTSDSFSLTLNDIASFETTDGVPQGTYLGKTLRWKVQACDGSGVCSGYSGPFTAHIPLPPAERTYPPERAVQRLPSTFAWREVPGASFYRLRINANTQSYVIDGLTNTRARVQAQDLTPAFPTIYDHNFSWEVQSCWQRPGEVGPVCSDRFFAVGFGEDTGVSFLKFTTGTPIAGFVNFLDHLSDTFKAPSCVNCHAARPTGFTSGGDGTFGLPASHQPVTAAQDADNPPGCVTCHNIQQQPLLAQGDLAGQIQWHAAPAGTDLRGLSHTELCARAQDAGSVAGSPGEHLSQDPLILWAVGNPDVGGALPFGVGPAEKAFPGSIAEWQVLVQGWNDLGTPCSYAHPTLCASDPVIGNLPVCQDMCTTSSNLSWCN
jgi:hypothetical protein